METTIGLSSSGDTVYPVVKHRQQVAQGERICLVIEYM